MSRTLLLVTRDASLEEAFQKVVRAVKGCRLVCFEDVEDALLYLDHPETSVVVFHQTEEIVEDDEDLCRLLQQISFAHLSTPVLTVVDKHRSEQVLAMMQMGIAECLARPLDLNRASFFIDSITLRARYEASIGVASAAAPRPPAVQRIGRQEPYLCCSGPMTRVVEQVRKVARHDASILLTGETGTGKSRTARLVHELSPRSTKPFVAVNCAALPETLIESELFGHRRGSFTGADADYVGRFGEAADGTLFLDEIDALPLALQAKLLRVVDERIYEQVGSSKPRSFQGRLIVATNHVLEAEVDAGRFRADLYYRLNVVEIPIPPLRQRRSEVRCIAEHQIQEIAARNRRPSARLGPGVLEILEAYDWPGNIRELRNVVERALVFCEQDEIVVTDLPQNLRATVAGSSRGPHHRSAHGDGPSLSEVSDTSDEDDSSMLACAPNVSKLARARIRAEIERIRKALQHHDNNRTEAARELGISRTALYKKLHQFELMDDPQVG